jgi:protein involved in polysaccharide export with SLBB domain
MEKMRNLLFVAFVSSITVAASYAQTPSQQQQQQSGATSAMQAAYAQSSQSSGASTQPGGMFTSSAQLFQSLQGGGVSVQPPPYDSPVDTNRYVLGPGDMVNLGVWGATPITQTLSVTPEGTLVFPPFGVLTVGGMSIAAANDYVQKELGKQFKHAVITLTLVYPRSFYIFAAGSVRHPSRYTANAFERVDKVFYQSNLAVSISDSMPVPNFSLRKIRLVHSDGRTEKVDLLKFYQAGDVSEDPFVNPGDAIVVPKEDFFDGNVIITGAVRMPGMYEYVPGDRFRDLLEISQGLTSIADSSKVKLYVWNQSQYVEKTIDLTDTSALNLPLTPYARIVVPIDRKKINNDYVWVTGEVRAPGIYPISPDSTKLSELISMAGGFTRWASLPDAVVYRTREPNAFTPSRQPFPSWFVSRATNLNAEAVGYASDELNMRAGNEIVSTDFVKLFADRDEKFDCFLQSGDSIYVPQTRRAIYVFGQVKYPGYVEYRAGWSYSDYISAAGGIKGGAEEGSIMILKHATYQWYKPGDTHLEPGDLVFVPRVSIKPELYSWNLFKDIIGTIGSVASIALTAILVIRTAQGK